MSLLALTLAYIRARALNAVLNLILLALGVGTIVLLLLFSAQLEDRLLRDARGFDLVIGAKGSPLQLILSSIYQIDFPTGNIPLTEFARWRQHPMVESAIPVRWATTSRVSGFSGLSMPMPNTTAPSSPLAGSGRRRLRRRWATVAAASGLRVGDRFVGSHGLAGGGAAHAEHPYTVVGVLAPTASVLDSLVLTPIESVWEVHGMHGPEHDVEENARKSAGSPEPVRPLEVTALLVHFRSPLGAVEVPQLVNREAGLQAASPALETARLMLLVGVGLDTLRGFGLLLIASAGLSVFIALWNAMQERRYDLAVMRTLGASRRVLFVQPLIEGLILAGGGAILGLLVGHGVATLVGRLLRPAQDMGLSGLTWRPGELYVILLALAVGLVSALLPAIQAYRTDIAQVLASRA